MPIPRAPRACRSPLRSPRRRRSGRQVEPCLNSNQGACGYVPGMETTPRRLTFGAHAEEYELARPEWPVEVARWFVPEDAALVIELGAGTGKLTRAVASLGVRVVAVEPDPRMLDVLRSGGFEGVQGSAEEIPIADGEADAVVAGSCVHWFDLEQALPEIHRVLRPGGRFGFGWN